MLKIRRPLGRLIFNMGIAIPGKTVFLIETAPRFPDAYMRHQTETRWRALDIVYYDVFQWPYQKETRIWIMRRRPRPGPWETPRRDIITHILSIFTVNLNVSQNKSPLKSCRAGPGLFPVNYDNTMAADALALCVISNHSTDYVRWTGPCFSFFPKDWFRVLVLFHFWAKISNTVEYHLNIVLYRHIVLYNKPKQNIDETLNSQKTPHSSPSRASYGVSIVFCTKLSVL